MRNPGRRMRNVAFIALTLWFCAGAAGAAGYLETFEQAGGAPASALGGVVKPGRDGAWSSSLNGGIYVLENKGNPGAVKYYYIVPGAGSLESFGDVVRVEVGVEPAAGASPSGAGLIFGYDPGTRDYSAFVLEADGRHALYRREAGKLRRVLSGQSGTAKGAGRDRLEVQFAGRAVRLLLNGNVVGSASMPGSRGEGVGLIALGAGRFAFDNFELPQAVGQAGGGARPAP